MAPKVPSDKALERALEDAVQSIFDSDERGELTVNYVRQVAEKKLGLEDGFFKSDDWKARSKEVALKAVDKAETEALSSQQSTGPPKPDSEDAESEPTPRPKPKAKAKQKDKPEPKPKPKPKPRSKPTKKRKAAASDDESESVSSDLSDASDSDDGSSSAESSDPAPKRKRAQPKTVARGKKRKPATDDDEDEEDSSASDSEPQHPKKKAKSEDKQKPAPKKKGKQKEETPASEPASGSAGSQSLLSDAPTRETAEPEAEVVPVAKVDTPIVDEESEMSEVFDEPPKRKGKGAKAAKGEPKTKKEPKTKAKTDKADFSPKGSLIRQLQMQLNKCGVRKVWGVLLKKYGDDKSAKIQHLKGMLSEVGMTGRFSESKAKEIKERRELEADLGEVIEGEKSWGFTASARPTRRGAAAAKARKVSSSGSGDEGEDPGGAKGGTGSGQSDDDESDDDDGQAKPRTRGPAKHRAALAFLGTDSESE